MKKVIMILVLGTLMACLVPAYAQTAQEWRSTSSMPTSGSPLAPQVTVVGATTIAEPATTTESYSPAKAPNGPRKGFLDPSNPGPQSNEDPIGDAVLPMMLMALAFGGVMYFRRRKAVRNETPTKRIS